MLAVTAERHRDLAERIRVGIDERGFAWMQGDFNDDDFVGLARTFGEICSDTPVRVIAGRRTYLASPDAIPIHTDHPWADIIAWRCVAQDPVDGASLLVDGLDVVRTLDNDTVRVLRALELPAMVRLGDPALPTPIVAGEVSPRIFYAPWLEPMTREIETRPALERWRSALHVATAIEIRMRPGDMLFADNRRMLHGRRRLAPESPRRLRRLWITATA